MRGRTMGCRVKPGNDALATWLDFTEIWSSSLSPQRALFAFRFPSHLRHFFRFCAGLNLAKLRAIRNRRVGKGAQRRAHVSVNANCKSVRGTLRFARPTLAVRDALKPPRQRNFVRESQQ